MIINYWLFNRLRLILMTSRSARTIICILFFLSFYLHVSGKENVLNSKFDKIIFGCYTENLKDFEEFALRAKLSGATHINLTNEDLPLSRWQYDTPGDPYPSWVITNIGLLKIATPEALKPYIPQDYAESVMAILEARCKILRKHGLKATFQTFEPQMLPEQVYVDYPLWRGPRVDHPMRSRVARWAPDIDNPEVLELYKESLSILFKRCPEIEIFSFKTNDSGTGLSWSRGLYDGSGGTSFYRSRNMDERLLGFFNAFQETASKIGGNIEIDIGWTRERLPARIAKNLPKGMAIENHEGPDATPFKAEVGFLLDYFQFYYPVLGIPQPVNFLNDLERASKSSAKRLFVFIGDRFNRDLYFSIYDNFNIQPSQGIISNLQFLNDLAAKIYGKENADNIFNIWFALGEAQKLDDAINTGGIIFYLGGVQQRWITRPFVPFPDELAPEEKNYYRQFQFQAKTEEDANDMANLQASRVYKGWSGSFHISIAMNEIRRNIRTARSAISGIMKTGLTNEQSKEFQLLDLRLQAFNLLCNNTENAIIYQAIIDHVKAVGCKPDPNPPGQNQSSWDRSLILETARKEIDNTALLIKLLESTGDVILDKASVKQEEDIRRLGPDLVDQLKLKLKIMNSKWLDYNRIFTVPNN